MLKSVPSDGENPVGIPRIATAVFVTLPPVPVPVPPPFATAVFVIFETAGAGAGACSELSRHRRCRFRQI